MDGSLGIIFNQDHTSVLLVKRRDIPVWVLPGGGIDPEESPEEAAIRETFEETGYEVDIIKKVGEYTNPKNGHKNHTFECQITGGQRTISRESGAIEFHQLDKMPKMTVPIMHLFIEDALNLKQNPVQKDIQPLPNTLWFRLLPHPWVLFKFILIKMGIHWNT